MLCASDGLGTDWMGLANLRRCVRICAALHPQYILWRLSFLPSLNPDCPRKPLNFYTHTQPHADKHLPDSQSRLQPGATG
jgi:hypothetical protein